MRTPDMQTRHEKQCTSGTHLSTTQLPTPTSPRSASSARMGMNCRAYWFSHTDLQGAGVARSGV